MGFDFAPEIDNSSRLIYILIAMIDSELPPEIYCNAVLVLEGLTFYAPGKRKAAMAGAIEQLDKFISE